MTSILAVQVTAKALCTGQQIYKKFSRKQRKEGVKEQRSEIRGPTYTWNNGYVIFQVKLDLEQT